MWMGIGGLVCLAMWLRGDCGCAVCVSRAAVVTAVAVVAVVCGWAAVVGVR